ncbi:MAG: TerB family tellurite resistance protein [Myxococcaceae bacterium]|nr:TerB family tellurite resistance protein [Myxococcaceae bacterium]
MSTVRHLFTARLAKPKVEASLRALVQAAVFLASADGEVDEREVESLVDSLRAVLARLVGSEHLDEYGKVAWLLDEARVARQALKAGASPFLASIAAVLEGELKRDAVRVAFDVVLADGREAPAERAALETLATALGVTVDDALSPRPA